MAFEGKICAVVGASGGIGHAFCTALEERGAAAIHRISRKGPIVLDYDRPDTVEAAAAELKVHGLQEGGLDCVIVATGLLHDEDGFGPEKSLKELDADALARAFYVNTIGPSLVARSFLPLLRREGPTHFAALSARVGSISDNFIGGWYGYRAAKAALNQMLRSAAIEHARRWPDSVVVGLHPGTVDTALSRPFQKRVPDGKLFTPQHAANSMLDTLAALKPEQTGRVFDYAGVEVPA